MRRLAGVVVLVLVACGGSSATSGSGEVWKDSAGRVVPRVLEREETGFGYGPGILIADDVGLLWRVDITTAEVTPSRFVQAMFFATTDCTGTPYIGPDNVEPPPRFTFTITERDSKVYARDDNSREASVSICANSTNDGECAALSMCRESTVLPVALRGLTAPQLGLVPPLHPEYVE